VTDHGYLTPIPSPPSSPLATTQQDTITSVGSSGSQDTSTTQVSSAAKSASPVRLVSSVPLLETIVDTKP
jgi:hypothetical protein